MLIDGERSNLLALDGKKLEWLKEHAKESSGQNVTFAILMTGGPPVGSVLKNVNWGTLSMYIMMSYLETMTVGQPKADRGEQHGAGVLLKHESAMCLFDWVDT